jgi:hypothetical protein
MREVRPFALTAMFVSCLIAGFAVAFASPASAAVTERSVFYVYDVAGRQTEAHFDSAAGADKIVNTYDGFGGLTSSQISMGGFSNGLTSAYDAGGRRTLLTHPGRSLAQFLSLVVQSREPLMLRRPVPKVLRLQKGLRPLRVQQMP